MAVYAIVIMVILAIVLVIFIILASLKESSNSKKSQYNIMYPFNTKLQSRDKNHPNGSTSAQLLTSNQEVKTPQIRCPTGTKINIIGAWSDVVDPNGTCSGKPSSTFGLSCGFSADISAGISCQTSDDCADGMTCTGALVCAPKACSVNKDCGGSYCGSVATSDGNVGKKCDSYSFTSTDGLVCMNGIIHKDPYAGQCLYCDLDRGDTPDQGYCAQSPSCGNLNDSVKNNTCIANKCVPRDASAYLAAQCDGKQECGITWNPMTDPTYFGPVACHDIKVDWSKPVTGTGVVPPFEQLPIAAGWDGGTPGTGDNVGKTDVNATYSQGYYVHGLYQCVPEDLQ